MRYGQFPTSARREQVQQMAQAMKPYNMRAKDQGKKFRETSPLKQDDRYNKFHEELRKISQTEQEKVPLTVRHQSLKDNQEMQNSVKKISSTISQAKDYILRQGIKC